MSKITASHLQRRAVVYVRQSTPDQVTRLRAHTASRRMPTRINCGSSLQGGLSLQERSPRKPPLRRGFAIKVISRVYSLVPMG